MKAMKLQSMVLPLVAAFLLCATPSKGRMVLPETLDDMSRADLIIRVQCEEKRKGTFTHPETKEDFPVWLYTFRTGEVLKGSAGATFKLQQWAIPSGEESGKRQYVPFSGTTSFDVGKEYLLFLSVPSLGFRTVLGFDQGKFNVTEDAQGKSMVVNPYNNRGLLKGVSPKGLSKSQQETLKIPAGPISYDELAPLIRRSVEK